MDKPPPEFALKNKMVIITMPAKVYHPKPKYLFCNPYIGDYMLDRMWVHRKLGTSLAVKKKELPTWGDITVFTKANSEELLRNIRLGGCPNLLKQDIVIVVEE